MTTIRAERKPLPELGKCIYCKKTLRRLRANTRTWRDICPAGCNYFVKHLDPGYAEAIETGKLRRKAVQDEAETRTNRTRVIGSEAADHTPSAAPAAVNEAKASGKTDGGASAD